MSQLHIITAVYNPAMYQSRYKLYQEFRRRMECCGALLYTIELAIGDQDFAVTDRNCHRDIQLRTRDEIWYKENLVNIALSRLPRNWEYVAWIDADLNFLRPDWIPQTVQKLKAHPFVQMFSHLIDLGPHFQPIMVRDGFAYRYCLGAKETYFPYAQGETGCAWAARRRELEAVRGLVDWGIVGSNDYFTSLGLVGALTPDLTRMPGSNHAAMLLKWQTLCERHVQRNIGFLNNTIIHYWHGRRKDRGYGTRWRILVDNHFDPELDLVRNAEGLLNLTDRNPTLRENIRTYFRARNEDSTER